MSDDKLEQALVSERRKFTAWLYARADSMNDEKAKAILRSAAFAWGVEKERRARPQQPEANGGNG